MPSTAAGRRFEEGSGGGPALAIGMGHGHGDHLPDQAEADGTGLSMIGRASIQDTVAPITAARAMTRA